MSLDFPILSLIVFLPLIGAIFIMMLLIGNEKVISSNAKSIALFTSFATLALSLLMYAGFDNANRGFQFIEKREWLPSFDIYYKLGIDGISLFFVVLTSFLSFISIVISWDNIKTKAQEYLIAFLTLETMLLGAFTALDTILFYIFFEAAIIPMFFIIGIWGKNKKAHSAIKLFVYNFLGSVFMLLALLYLSDIFDTTDIEVLQSAEIASDVQKYIFWAFLTSFAVKIPMFPIHNWFVDAHSDSNTAASFMLSGMLVNLGGYGFLRLALPLLPDAVAYFTPMMFTLSVVAIIYASLIACVQKDIKRLLSYAAIANMGFVTLGIFAFSQMSIEGALIQMISCSVTFAGLFLIASNYAEKLGEVKVSRLVLLYIMALLAIPSSGGFVGKFLILLGTIDASNYAVLFAALTTVLSACYGFNMYKGIVVDDNNVKKLIDIKIYEKLVLASLLVIIFWLGIYPSNVLESISPSVAKIVERNVK